MFRALPAALDLEKYLHPQVIYETFFIHGYPLCFPDDYLNILFITKTHKGTHFQVRQ